jgi:hypothetical protein
MNTATGPLATDADLWRWQHNALSDLLAFVTEHKPGSAAPLPALPWRLAFGRAVSADLTAHNAGPGVQSPEQLRAILAQYADVLGSDVQEVALSGKTRYKVSGRIGQREGTARQPRTEMHLSTDIWLDDDPDA